MAKAARSTIVGAEIAKALGVPDVNRVTSLVLRVGTDGMVTLEVESLVVDEQANELTTLLTKYEIVEKEAHVLSTLSYAGD